ncbi:MAG: endonuclease/exonuclease/phosphatase family protein [Turneriella sp.]|nr:endonuclease/exonuclease/phosphatase family protein [Turneriella sp.]
MRIISWNCNGAFRNKLRFISELEPDILIIQECEDLKKIEFDMFSKPIYEGYWFGGENKSKGLGFFIMHEGISSLPVMWEIEEDLVVPKVICYKDQKILLFSIWTWPPKYNWAIIQSIRKYSKIIRHFKTICMGDFNAPYIAEDERFQKNIYNVANEFRKQGMLSIYHERANVNFGSENEFTWFRHKKATQPYFLDYCFISQSLLPDVIAYRIERFQDWRFHSDHCPIVLEIK